MIAIGMALVVASIAGFVYAVPNGPVWLVAMFAAKEGGVQEQSKLEPSASVIDTVAKPAYVRD